MQELESLSAFLERTSGFTADSLPRSGGLQTSSNLPLKVGTGGKLQPFLGSTVVFPLPEEVRRKISWVQDLLYRTCAPALAEPLDPASFHITLHDLLNGTPTQDLERRISRMREPALDCIRRIAESGETVCLRSTALFNMVGTSMVLGFAPTSEESCRRLMMYYEMLQEIFCLDYPLTPHVTVAYFRPGKIAEEMVRRLHSVIREVNRREEIFMELPARTIEYQIFSDMNHYRREI